MLASVAAARIQAARDPGATRYPQQSFCNWTGGHFTLP